MVEPDADISVELDPLAGGEATRKSIWPAIYPKILELVEAHTSTLVFVNNRRGAERLALRLNELSERDIARAHHGSLAREERLIVEEQLKGRRAAVPRRHELARARHRHGAIDLVLQVESPSR
jgi:ATP-dependent Lhr-like helicase